MKTHKKLDKSIEAKKKKLKQNFYKILDTNPKDWYEETFAIIRHYIWSRRCNREHIANIVNNSFRIECLKF